MSYGTLDPHLDVIQVKQLEGFGILVVCQLAIVNLSRNYRLRTRSRLGDLSRTAPWLVPRLSRLVLRWPR